MRRSNYQLHDPNSRTCKCQVVTWLLLLGPALQVLLGQLSAKGPSLDPPPAAPGSMHYTSGTPSHNTCVCAVADR